MKLLIRIKEEKMRKVAMVILSWLCSLSAVAHQSQGHIVQFEKEQRQQRDQIWQSRQKQWLDKRTYQQEEYLEDMKNISIECIPYTELRFRGVNEIDHRPFIPQKGECLNEEKLNQLSRAMTKAYLEKGILHTPFRFETTLENQLVLVVTEGRLKEVSGNSNRLNFATLLPNRQGKILKVQDLDQALDQANKMRGSQVTVDVHPSNDGSIALDFVNQETNRVRGVLGINNFSNSHYRRWQAKGSASVDSPFGLSDTLNLNVAHTLNGYKRYSRSASLYYSVPYGYWSANAFASFSQYKQHLTLPNTEVEQQGRTLQSGLGLDYVVNRGSHSVTTLSAQLEHLNTKNRFADTILLLQSPKLTTYQAGLSHLQLFPNGALSANMAYKHGLSWFNALANQGREQPEGRYGKWFGELYLQYYHRLSEQTFKQSHRLQGQYSRNYLAGAEQADLTGRYAVRGLNDVGISAEKNLVLRNQFAWLQRWQAVHFSPYIAFDMGTAKHSDDQATSQRAWGYALGMTLEQPERWNALVEWASGRVKTDKKTPAVKDRNLDLSVELIF